MYDWANSGYATSALGVFFPVYFVILFKDAFGDETYFFGMTFTGSSTWSLGLAISTAIVALSSPVLGVIADRVAIKKTLLCIYMIGGSVFAVLAFFSVYMSYPWAWLGGAVLLGNIGFNGSIVFYNSMLPHIAPRGLLDDVSSRGFAYGYVGGGLLLLVHLIMLNFVSGTDATDLMTRICIASTGFWWFGWAVWTLKVVPEPPISNRVDGITLTSSIGLAFRELFQTFREITKFKVILIYLCAYLFFNDGIQTIIGIASAFAIDTLLIDQLFIVVAFLIIQFVAAVAAMGFSWLAATITTKNALYVALVGWIVIVIFGVAIVRLVPDQHGDFDYQLSYQSESRLYVVEAAPELTISKTDRLWKGERGHVNRDQEVTFNNAKKLLSGITSSDNSRFSMSIVGGPMDGKMGVGILHPSLLGKGPVDWWPSMVRSLIWKPFALNAEFQYLILGVGVGLVMGGSQALARSLFAQLIPEKRSAEFFSFFGFMGRASSVFGPIVYFMVTGVFDTRLAVVSIVFIITIGMIILHWVDVPKGIQVAAIEDGRK